MSKEYSMDPYNDSHDWQRRQDRKLDKPNGAPVVIEETSADVVPEITKARFIRTALAIETDPTLAKMDYHQKKGLISKALVYALRVQPTAKAIEVENELKARTEAEETQSAIGVKKFLTLADIPRSRDLAMVG